MPANLTPEYRDAERAFKEAASTPEKIDALEHMLEGVDFFRRARSFFECTLGVAVLRRKVGRHREAPVNC